MAHCLLTPLVLALVPIGTAIGIWHSGVHLVFLFAVPLIAAVAFVPGWRLHRDSRVWIFAAIGFVFLLAGSQIGGLLGLDHVAHFEYFRHASVEGLQDLQPTSFQWAPLVAELFFTSLGGYFFIRAHLLNRKLCSCCIRDHVHEPQVVV